MGHPLGHPCPSAVAYRVPSSVVRPSLEEVRRGPALEVRPSAVACRVPSSEGRPSLVGDRPCPSEVADRLGQLRVSNRTIRGYKTIHINRSHTSRWRTASRGHHLLARHAQAAHRAAEALRRRGDVGRRRHGDTAARRLGRARRGASTAHTSLLQRENASEERRGGGNIPQVVVALRSTSTQ